MAFQIHRPRQIVGSLYILIYLSIFLAYGFFRSDGQSWTMESKFTVAVMVWFLLSLAVKVSMVMNRVLELLNLVAVVAFMSIGFTYIPQPDHFSSIENLCYYLNLLGGSACDLFDFIYAGAARRPGSSAVAGTPKRGS